MLRSPLLAGLVAVFIAFPSHAQDVPGGGIAGRVMEQGALRPLPGATVRLIPGDRGDVTDSEGRFRFPGLSGGRYVIEVRFLGFVPTVRPDLEVTPGRTTVVEVLLEPAVIEADGVEVTAGWYPGAVDDPSPVRLFSREEIRRAAGAAGDVQRLIAGLPAVARLDDMRNALAVRGGSPLETRFVVDDIPIANLNHFPAQGSSGGALGIVAADLIGEVSFRPGGFGVSQADRLGAVVDLDLRPPTERPLAFRGDFSLAGAGLFAEGTSTPARISWIAGARRSWVDLLVDHFLEEQADAVPRYGDGILAVSWRPNPRHEVRFLDLLAIDRSGINREEAMDAHENLFGDADFDANTAGLRWRVLHGGSGLGVTTLSHGWSGRRIEFSSTSTGMPYLDDTSDEYVVRAAHTERVALSRSLSIEAGIEVERKVARYRTRVTGEQTELPERLARTRTGGFLQASWAPFAWLRAIPGIRVDRTAGRHAVQPRGAARFRMPHGVWLGLSAGVYAQQLPLALIAREPGYGSLPAPLATHFMADVTWEPRPAMRVRIDGYVKTYRRLPQDPDTPFSFALDRLFDDALPLPLWPTYGTLTADARARTRGVEISVQQRLARRFYGMAAVGISRSEYRDATGAWRPRLFDTRIVATVDGGYRPNDRHQIGVRLTLAGGRPWTPFDEEASLAAGTGVPDPTRPQAGRLPDYHALALRYDRRFRVGGAWIVGYVSVWNVYGRRNVAGYYWDEVDQRVRQRLQWGTLPVLGFEVLFR